MKVKEKSAKKKRNAGRRAGWSIRCLQFFILLMIVTQPVYASAAEPVIVSGTRKLVAAATGLLTALVAGMGTFNALKVGTKWINSPAEERPKFQKELILVIIATVVTLTIGSTLTYIIGFYS